MTTSRGYMRPKALRDLIARAGVTQGEAARRLGVSRQTVVRWLSGTVPIGKAATNLIRLTFPVK